MALFSLRLAKLDSDSTNEDIKLTVNTCTSHPPRSQGFAVRNWEGQNALRTSLTRDNQNPIIHVSTSCEQVKRDHFRAQIGAFIYLIYKWLFLATSWVVSHCYGPSFKHHSRDRREDRGSVDTPYRSVLLCLFEPLINVKKYWAARRIFVLSI